MMNDRYIQQLEEQGFIQDKSYDWKAIYDPEKQHLNPLSRLRSEVRNNSFTGKARGGRFLRISPGDGEHWFVKQYHRGGLLAKEGDTSYRSPDRFLAELVAAVRSRDLDIPVPDPVGVFWKQTDSRYSGFYVSEWIDSRRATQYLRDTEDASLMFQLGQILARLHDEGIDHQDYKLDNVLIDLKGDVDVIDFDPVRFGNVSLLTREQRLHRFFRFLSKYGFESCGESAFLKGYRSTTDTYSSVVHQSLQLSNWVKNTGSDLIHYGSTSSLKPVDLEKVLLRVPNWLGDCVMSLPFLQSFTEKLERERIDVVCRANVQSVFHACPGVNQVFPLDTNKTTTFPDETNEERYSLALVLPKSFRTALQAWRSGIPRRRGFATGLRSALLTDRIPLENKHRTLHHARLYYELMPDLLEQPPEFPTPDLSIPEEWKAETPDEWYANTYITIHPGSAYGPAKRWPAEQFQEMLRRFLSENDVGVTFLGVSSEREIAENVKGNLPDERITNLVGKTSLKQCMVILEHSRATVANDSGIMHLAAALDTPVLALFGSSTPDLTSPLGSNHRVIYRNVECSPCFEEKCPRTSKRYKCLTQIEPDEVHQRLTSLLDDTEPEHVSN